MTDDQLQFIDYRKPKLEAGDYQFTVTHQFGDPNHSTEHQKQLSHINIRAEGERVTIKSEDVFAQYPPAGESGDFSDVLPHISFNKASLPWLRSAYEKSADNSAESHEPWLYLLAINEQDLAQGRAHINAPMALADLDKNAFFPSEQKQALMIDPSINQAEQMLHTIDIKKSLFNALFAYQNEQENDKEAIKYLAHIRRRWQPIKNTDSEHELTYQIPLQAVAVLDNAKFNDHSINIHDLLNLPKTAQKIVVLKAGTSWLVNDEHQGDRLFDLSNAEVSEGKVEVKVSRLSRELSVLMANRLAQNYATSFPEGTRNHALVISLEQYLTTEVRTKINALTDDDNLRFIVLTSWWYNCTSQAVNFKERTGLLSVDSLRLPSHQLANNPGLSTRVNAGFVALSHQFRQGAESISWYRGPLIPFGLANIEQRLTAYQLAKTVNTEGAENTVFSASDADRLLSYDPSDGMFDISYAAAYELGRMLSFKNTEFTQALAQYKRGLARYIKLNKTDIQRKQATDQQGICIENLPYAQLTDEVSEPQLVLIEQWLLSLSRLEGIPSWNLLADQALLPERSLRCFSIDPLWIQSLWLGALSLNGRAKVTNQLFDTLYNKLKNTIPRYGAFLRSDIVWAYPEVVVTAKNRADMSTAIPLVSKQKIAQDCQLYLTNKSFDYLSLSLPPESLHYGLTLANDEQGYYKEINFKGERINTVKVSFLEQALGIVNIAELANDIANSITNSKVMDNSQAKKNYKTQLTDTEFRSAKLSRFMLKGEAQAEFTLSLAASEDK